MRSTPMPPIQAAISDRTPTPFECEMLAYHLFGERMALLGNTSYSDLQSKGYRFEIAPDFSSACMVHPDFSA
ncbi:MAG: hypothetical protein ACK5JO_08410 [Halodesulfovibrio sp.]